MKKKKKRTAEMWDLLLPVMLVAGVLPLIVHLAVYSCGYSRYDWYYTNDVLADLYCYYKSYFLDVIAFFACVILLFRRALYRDKRKKTAFLAPLLFYCVFVIVSTICSVNPAASLQGNFESFESCFVLLSYIVIFLYTYQVMQKERDYEILWRVFLWLCAAFLVIGAFQVSGHDLLDFTWVQKLVMSEDNYAVYGGEMQNIFRPRQVYLTLYNPNYAGVVLGMLFAIVLFMAVTEKKEMRRKGLALCLVLLAGMLWFTYSRASLLTAMITVILTIVWLVRIHDGQGGRKGNKNVWLFMAGTGAVFLVLVFVDAFAGFPFLSRILERNDREPLEAMVTDQEGIHIRYDGTEYLLCLREGELVCINRQTGETAASAEGIALRLPMDEQGSAVCYGGDEGQIMVFLFDTTLTFVQEEDGYYYQNAAGKTSRMVEVEAADFHGLEYVGSARGYIWSRVVPLLKNYMAAGSGPDTFAEVFPQNDYAGKIVYADDPDRVIEKAHNDYLMKWVQTGFLSMLCMVAFYVVFLILCGRQYWGRGRETGTSDFTQTMRYRLGMGCYLACISYMAASFFNDSTIQTSPLFWVCAGIALSSAVPSHSPSA